MFQERVSVIRDPGGNSLVRIVPELCGRGRGVTDESILIVPPGTKAYIAVNGTLLENPILPGRYSLYGTGESNPFFRRLKHFLTNSDPGTSFSVFFVSDEKKELVDLKTGEILIREKKTNLTMKVYGSINLALTIGDPLLLLKKIVGTWNHWGFSTSEDMEPCFRLLVLPHVRETLAAELARLDIIEFNQHLSRLSKQVAPTIAARLEKNGGLRLEPEDCMISGFQFPPAEIQRLYALETKRAGGLIDTDLELDQLQRIYGGDLQRRTMAYAVGGVPPRGQAAPGNGNAGNGNGIMAPMMQMAMMAQLMPMFRGDSMDDDNTHTDLFGGMTKDMYDDLSQATAGQGSTPDNQRRCPSCNANVDRDAFSCPVCGYIFRKERKK